MSLSLDFQPLLLLSPELLRLLGQLAAIGIPGIAFAAWVFKKTRR
jgi:hypothetical protein